MTSENINNEKIYLFINKRWLSYQHLSWLKKEIKAMSHAVKNSLKPYDKENTQSIMFEWKGYDQTIKDIENYILLKEII